jgi:FdhD protein
MEIYRPQMTQAGMSLTFSVDAINASGRQVCVEIPYEFPLTLHLDGHEIATLMTLGTHPEELVLGYLRNQGMIHVIEDVASVMINWEEETAWVATFHGNVGVDQPNGSRVSSRFGIDHDWAREKKPLLSLQWFGKSHL